MADHLATAESQQHITYEAHPCPTCGQAMVGARVFDPQAQEAFVGAVCVPCDAAYRVIEIEQESQRADAGCTPGDVGPSNGRR